MSNYLSNNESKYGCGIIALILGIALAMDAFVAWIFQMLWNFVLPDLFGFPVINFWQAFAIWIIIGLIGSAFKAIASSNK